MSAEDSLLACIILRPCGRYAAQWCGAVVRRPRLHARRSEQSASPGDHLLGLVSRFWIVAIGAPAGHLMET
jgi:hypothetical protein